MLVQPSVRHFSQPIELKKSSETTTSHSPKGTKLPYNPTKMEHVISFYSFFSAIAFLHLVWFPHCSAQFAVGGGVGVWDGGGGGGGGGGGSTINSQTPPAFSDQSHGSEYTALQAFKAAITEDPGGVLSSWIGPNVCLYKGVYCSSPPESISSSTSSVYVVAGIDLNRANLKGSLVRDISLLSDLIFLHLNTNRFSGTIPDTLKDLQYLTEIDLSNNLFSGTFPTTTLYIPSLIYLDLRYNSFSGEVPEELFQKNLDAIFLNNNQFEGQIPMSLWASSASVITLANNHFSGSIPSSYGYMSSGLKEVLFLNNKLTGCIPEGLGFMSNIEVLDFSFNSLSGHLPNTLSCLSGIQVLNIAHNQLSGELPDLVCDLKKLANLSVSFNFFSGFSQDCNRLVVRNVGFDFSANCIPGRDMQRPQPECMDAPGGDLSCLRIPGTRPMACAGSMMGMIQGGIEGYIPISLHASLPSVTVSVP